MKPNKIQKALRLAYPVITPPEASVVACVGAALTHWDVLAGQGGPPFGGSSSGSGTSGGGASSSGSAGGALTVAKNSVIALVAASGLYYAGTSIQDAIEQTKVSQSTEQASQEESQDPNSPFGVLGLMENIFDTQSRMSHRGDSEAQSLLHAGLLSEKNKPAPRASVSPEGFGIPTGFRAQEMREGQKRFIKISCDPYSKEAVKPKTIEVWVRDHEGHRSFAQLSIGTAGEKLEARFVIDPSKTRWSEGLSFQLKIIGKQSELWSDPILVALKPDLPTPPKNLSVRRTDFGIEFQWSRAEPHQYGDRAVLYMSESKFSGFHEIENVSAEITKYSMNSNSDSSSTLYFKMATLNGSLKSSDSETVSLTPEATPAPFELWARRTSTRMIDLEWKLKSWNVDFTEIECSVSSVDNFKLAEKVQGATTRAQVDCAPADQDPNELDLFFRAIARGTNGRSRFSNTVKLPAHQFEAGETPDSGDGPTNEPPPNNPQGGTGTNTGTGTTTNSNTGAGTGSGTSTGTGTGTGTGNGSSSGASSGASSSGSGGSSGGSSSGGTGTGTRTGTSTGTGTGTGGSLGRVTGFDGWHLATMWSFWLLWDPIQNPAGKTLTIQKREDQQGAWVTIATLPATETKFITPAYSEKKLFQFQISVSQGANTSPWTVTDECPGDVNNDKVVDLEDVDTWDNTPGKGVVKDPNNPKTWARVDVLGNGKVNFSDLGFLQQRANPVTDCR